MNQTNGGDMRWEWFVCSACTRCNNSLYQRLMVLRSTGNIWEIYFLSGSVIHLTNKLPIGQWAFNLFADCTRANWIGSISSLKRQVKTLFSRGVNFVEVWISPDPWRQTVQHHTRPCFLWTSHYRALLFSSSPIWQMTGTMNHCVSRVFF